MPTINAVNPPTAPAGATPVLPKSPVTPPAHTRAKGRKKKWILLFAAAAIAAGALVAYRMAGGNTVTYSIAAVDRGDIQAAITTTGTLNAVKTVLVGSQVSGNILDLYADFNTKVKKGQLVAKIDPAIFQARVDQSKASLDSANAAVVSARANIKRAESDIATAQANVATQNANLARAQSAVTDSKIKNDRRIQMFKDGIIAQEDADTAKSTYDQAVASLDAAKATVTASQSGVESAKAQLDVAQTQVQTAIAQMKQSTAALQQAQIDLAHTNIYAPVDGTVISRNMDVGQTVAASFQAPTIFQIAQDLTKMQVDTNVDEADIAPIQVGQNAAFTVDAYPSSPFTGQVTQIRKAPINVQNVVTYNVVVQVDNPDLKLFPGMTANVKVITGHADHALRIPVAALRFRPAVATIKTAASGTSPNGKGNGSGRGGQGKGRTQGGQEQTVYILQQGAPAPVRVRLGLTDGNFIEVLKGLTEGQPVVTGTVSKNAPAPAQQAPTVPGGRRFGF